MKQEESRRKTREAERVEKERHVEKEADDINAVIAHMQVLPPDVLSSYKKKAMEESMIFGMLNDHLYRSKLLSIVRKDMNNEHD